MLDVQRVVTLPRLEGPAIAGLPSDEHGFLVADEFGRVAPGVYAAGDVTAYEIKQGGIACQQADAAASHIAARAGAPVTPEPFTPELRGLLLTEHWARYLKPDSGASILATRGLSWPPTKIAGRELARYLKTLEPVTPALTRAMNMRFTTGDSPPEYDDAARTRYDAACRPRLPEPNPF